MRKYSRLRSKINWLRKKVSWDFKNCQAKANKSNQAMTKY